MALANGAISEGTSFSCTTSQSLLSPWYLTKEICVLILPPSLPLSIDFKRALTGKIAALDELEISVSFRVTKHQRFHRVSLTANYPVHPLVGLGLHPAPVLAIVIREGVAKRDIEFR